MTQFGHFHESLRRKFKFWKISLILSKLTICKLFPPKLWQKLKKQSFFSRSFFSIQFHQPIVLFIKRFACPTKCDLYARFQVQSKSFRYFQLFFQVQVQWLLQAMHRILSLHFSLIKIQITDNWLSWWSTLVMTKLAFTWFNLWNLAHSFDLLYYWRLIFALFLLWHSG